MSLRSAPVQSCDIQDIDLSIDLPKVVGNHVNSHSDIKDLLVNVDYRDVSKFVINWLNENHSSDEFVTALKHIMYSSTMLNVASEIISAAEQEIEESSNGEESLCVEELLLEEIAKRFQKVLRKNTDTKHFIQQQLVGDYKRRVDKLSEIVDAAKDLYITTLDNNTLHLEERIGAAEKLKEINLFLDECKNQSSCTA